MQANKHKGKEKWALRATADASLLVAQARKPSSCPVSGRYYESFQENDNQAFGREQWGHVKVVEETTGTSHKHLC